MMKTVTLSFDIEEFDFPLERGKQIDFETQLDVSSEGLEYLLDMLESKGVKATFYVTANFALNRRDLVRRIVSSGHELASHDFFHSADAKSDPAAGKKVLEEISGVPVIGYRAPRLAECPQKELVAAGFKYNSSINPTLIPGRYNNLRHPRTAVERDGLIVYPTSVAYPVRIPLFWLSLHIFPLWFYERLAKSALRKDSNLSLYFHPWEFSNRLKESDFRIPFYISSCSGSDLRTKLEKFVDYFLNMGCSFVTTTEYLSALDKLKKI